MQSAPASQDLSQPSEVRAPSLLDGKSHDPATAPSAGSAPSAQDKSLAGSHPASQVILSQNPGAVADIKLPYVVKDAILMGPGVWNDTIYTPAEVRASFNNTDWSDQTVHKMYYDHLDDGAMTYVGFTSNEHMEGDLLIGDLNITNIQAAIDLEKSPSKTFGISPRLHGMLVNMGGGTGMSSFSYDNFSLVNDPACKLNWIEHSSSGKKYAGGIAGVKAAAVELSNNTRGEVNMGEENAKTAPQAAATAPVDVKELASEISKSMKEGFQMLAQKMEKPATEELSNAQRATMPANSAPAGGQVATMTLRDHVKKIDAKVRGAMYIKHLSQMDPNKFEHSNLDEFGRRLLDQAASTIKTLSTTTSTSGVSGITPALWSDDVEQQGENLRVARSFVKIDRSLMGRSGNVAHIIKGVRLTTGSDVSTSPAEATEGTVYDLDDFATLDLTPASYRTTVRISDEVIEQVNVDAISEANRAIAEVLAQYEDVTILALANTATGAVFGGDATTDGTLDTGDVLTTDMIVLARQTIATARYKADVMFISPAQEGALLKDSQFVSAAEYGSDAVVRNGEIGNYLGMKVIVTNNVAATVSQNSGTGHRCWMFDSSKAVSLALKQDIRVESFREVNRQSYVIVGTIKFATGYRFAGAACKLPVSDA